MAKKVKPKPADIRRVAEKMYEEIFPIRHADPKEQATYQTKGKWDRLLEIAPAVAKDWICIAEWHLMNGGGV
jgi:hypothetical protein